MRKVLKDTKSLLLENMAKLNPDFQLREEDEKWIQKAVDPEHKGYCTPMTKPTCTPQRKALAKRFKKGIENEAYGVPAPLGKSMAKQVSEDSFKDRERNAGVEPDSREDIKKWSKQYVKMQKGVNNFIPVLYYKPYMGPTDGKIYYKVNGEYVSEGAKSVTEDEMNAQPEQGGVKYRAEVTGVKENTWSGNGMEYDTEEEAKKWLDGLANRWFGYDMGRVVPITTPRNQPVDMQNDIIYQNFRE